MDMFSGAIGGTTFGLVASMFWLIVQASVATSRMERKLDALLKQSGVDLEQLATQEAQETQRRVHRRRLLVWLLLLGLPLGVALVVGAIVFPMM